MILLLLVGIVSLIMLSSFFSALETALPAASKTKIHQIAKSGDARASILQKMTQNLGGIISGLLMGNTVVNVCITMLSTSLLIPIIESYLPNFGEIGAGIIMTFVIVLFCEVIPKVYAIAYAEEIALKSTTLMQPFLSILLPLAFYMEKCAKILLNLFGVKISKDLSYNTIEELKGAIDMHNGPTKNTHQERVMLKGILDLNQVNVDEIMIHRKHVMMLDASESIENLINAVLSSPHTRLPIWSGEKENIIGILHSKTFLKELRAKKNKLDKKRILEISQKPWFIPESTNLLEQLQEFRHRREHFSIVVDEYGAFMGVVTLEDILEEIVGEIVDESDIHVSGVRGQPDGSYVINGDVTIRDLNRQFEWSLKDEEAATIAGLIIWETRTLPDVNQVFMIQGFRIEILKKQRHQITVVRLTPP